MVDIGGRQDQIQWDPLECQDQIQWDPLECQDLYQFNLRYNITILKNENGSKESYGRIM